MEQEHRTDTGEPEGEPARQGAEPPNGMHGTAPVSDDTIAQKPSTFDLTHHPEVKRSTRYGEVFLGEKATIQLTLQWKDATVTLMVQVAERIVVGRSAAKGEKQPDVSLGRYGGYINGISRQHLAITKDGNILMVTDLGSKNGTHLNGAKLMPHQARVLRNGDELHIGTLPVRVNFGPTGTLT